MSNLPLATVQPQNRPGLRTNQLNFLIKVLSKLYYHECAPPFRFPDGADNSSETSVTYLETIEERVQKQLYTNAKAAIADVYKIFDNCCASNSADSDVFQKAKTIKRVFKGHLITMPRDEVLIPPNESIQLTAADHKRKGKDTMQGPANKKVKLFLFQ